VPLFLSNYWRANCLAMLKALLPVSVNGKVGLIQAANDGTLFLDEIGDMPLTLQAKLLRAIESREIQPVGASPRSRQYSYYLRHQSKPRPVYRRR
jgi:sigma54-dependent transcription regulator